MNPTLQGVTRLKDLWLSMGPRGPFLSSRLRVTLRLLMGQEYLYANDALRNVVR